jgi:hypothetical protein
MSPRWLIRNGAGWFAVTGGCQLLPGETAISYRTPLNRAKSEPDATAVTGLPPDTESVIDSVAILTQGFATPAGHVEHRIGGNTIITII